MEVYIIDYTIYEWQTSHESNHYRLFTDLEEAKRQFVKLCNKAYVIKACLYETISHKKEITPHRVVAQYPTQDDREGIDQECKYCEHSEGPMDYNCYRCKLQNRDVGILDPVRTDKECPFFKNNMQM